MSALRFESEESLRFSITSGLVPESVLADGADTWRDVDGGIIVAPAKALSPEVMDGLVAAGVRRLRPKRSPESARVSCWAELVGLVRTREIEAEVGQVLFLLSDGASLVGLAGELIRLGCDRLEHRALADRRHLLRAFAPPYYSLLGAMDASTKIVAYVPAPKGQDRVWVELGFEHLLARLLRPSAGTLLCVSSSAAGARAVFLPLPDGPFADMYTLVELKVPVADRADRRYEADPSLPRVAVTLRLARSSVTDPPSLWVIREDAVAMVERLLASLPEAVADGLLFLPCKGDSGTVIIVRSRPSAARTAIEIDGEAYRPHPSIANLLLPCDATLEPPLRRDRLCELLAPDPDDVVWLRPLGGGRFEVERAPDGLFRPLSEWVDYVVDSNAPTLLPWVRSATFDFDAFVGVDPQEASTMYASEPEPPRRAMKREVARADGPRRPVRAEVREATAPPASVTLGGAVLELDSVAEELAAVEKAFFALDAPSDDPGRLASWQRMASLNARLGRSHDAALCWARVAWEAPAGQLSAPLETWSATEQGLVHGASVRTLLALAEPSRDHVRALAVLVVRGADPGLLEVVEEASLWLDRHEDALDVRSAWLARSALSRLVGGDRLGLARARDRLLAKMQRGLSLERDVPSFLRRAGGGRDAAQVELVAERLGGLLERFDRTKRKRSATEADPMLTGAYVRFVIAYGLARLGRGEQATLLRESATKALPKGDPIHDLLSRAYAARIGQALEARDPETPLPPELSASLNGLAKLDRYKVDRVRQCSKILEPQERLDPIMAFQRGAADPRGPEFAELRGVSDREFVDRATLAIMAKAKASGPEERARLYDGIMDFFPLVSHEQATAHLETILGDVGDVAAQRRVELLEEALGLAGHLGEEALARKIFSVLEPLVAAVGADGAAAIAPLASGMLRTLRRFGLRDEAESLLGALAVTARGSGTVHLVARLYTAAALAYLGQVDRARPVFEDALTLLKGELPMPDRLKLTRATARALGAAPLAYAVAGLEQLETKLEVVTDSFNTNSHVCLSVVDFMEALVLGYASEDLSNDHLARRFLDDDEYLVRRRIHRDLSR